MAQLSEWPRYQVVQRRFWVAVLIGAAVVVGYFLAVGNVGDRRVLWWIGVVLVCAFGVLLAMWEKHSTSLRCPYCNGQFFSVWQGRQGVYPSRCSKCGREVPPTW